MQNPRRCLSKLVARVLLTILPLVASADSTVPPKPSEAGSCRLVEPPAGDKREADFIRQIATIAAMRDMSAVAELAIEDGLVVSVDTVVVRLTKNRMCDGWGRPILVFGRADAFLMISYGRNGRPDPPQKRPSDGVMPSPNYDEDIYIAGTAKEPWIPVQAPIGVDLH